MRQHRTQAGFAAATLIAGLASSGVRAEDYCFPGFAYTGSNPDGSLAKCNELLAKEQKPEGKSKILVFMAGAYEAKKDFDKAIATFDEALKLDPNNANGYYYRGSFFRFHRKNLERALSNYSAAIKLDPSYPNYSARGDIYAEMDRLEEATADYDAALRGAPTSVTLLVTRGNVWRRRGDWNRALADYEQAVKLDATYSNATNARSAAHAVLGLGPALAGAQDPAQPPVAESRFKWASSKKIGSYPVDVWTLDGKVHHCAITSSYGEPASAVGRSAAGYALTVASGKWALGSQKSYAVDVMTDRSSQPAKAMAVDKITLGIPVKPDAGFLADWTRTYKLKVKSPRSTMEVDGSGQSALQAVDECWRGAGSTAAGADPFASP